MPQFTCDECGAARSSSDSARKGECNRVDGYNKRGNRYAKFYDCLCCHCACMRGHDLTIYGGCCKNCLSKSLESLQSCKSLHLDSLCAFLSDLIYHGDVDRLSFKSVVEDQFHLVGANGLAKGEGTEETGPGFAVLADKIGLNLIIVVFRGSATFMDWIVNLGSNLYGIGPDGQKFNVHNGIHGRLGEADDHGMSYDGRILEYINVGKQTLKDPGSAKIVYTGHSLGGGLALICRSMHHAAGIKEADVVCFGAPLVVASDPAASSTLQEIAKSTRLYVHGFDIITRMLLFRDAPRFAELVENHIKAEYPAFWTGGGILGVGGHLKQSFCKMLEEFMKHSEKYRTIGQVIFVQNNHGSAREMAFAKISCEAKYLSQLPTDVKCFPEDQIHYRITRMIDDHKMEEYVKALEAICWCSAPEVEFDYKVAAFSARLRWVYKLQQNSYDLTGSKGDSSSSRLL
mmetsp:Transcript_43927/g.138673  ORF Transcript_43927/g.138673 Transcript_43927/m.138673 type:complete len:458 (-) Transcript_43927:141-1514(-)